MQMVEGEGGAEGEKNTDGNLLGTIVGQRRRKRANE